MIILDVPQRSDEWFKARAGIPSASEFDKILTPLGSPSKQADKYMKHLARERLTGPSKEGYQNATMLRGIELEVEARLYFEMLYDVEIKEVGFCYSDEKKLYGCSPDGLNESFGLEIKCPEDHTHITYLFENKLPTDYIPQVQGGMLVTGFSSWYFLSYFPGLAPLIIQVLRDWDYTARLKVALDEFCIELDELTERLRKLI